MERRFIASIKILLVAVFALQIYRAATHPIGSGEAYLYDRFVRPTTRQVLASELLDRNVLYCILEKRSVGLLHVSPFSVRAPGLLFGILYLWVVWRLMRHWNPSVLLALVPVFWDGFARAEGAGAAVALCACAVYLAVERKHLNWIGICLGLSISAEIRFAIPAAVVALTVLAMQRRWTEWCDDVLIPAAVSAVIILVLPLSHAHAPAETRKELSADQARHLQTVLAVLQSTVGIDHVAIASTASAEPIVNFYRAQHRTTTWERAKVDDGSEHFDYYLLSAAATPSPEERHLIVVHRDAEFVLARGQAARL